MYPLLDAAQVERVAVPVAYHQAEHFRVEVPAARQIADGVDEVARTGDAERR